MFNHDIWHLFSRGGRICLGSGGLPLQGGLPWQGVCLGDGGSALARGSALVMGVCLGRGGLPWLGGLPWRGGVCLGRRADIPPPRSWAEWVTHTCENITFVRFAMQAVIRVHSQRVAGCGYYHTGTLHLDACAWALHPNYSVNHCS